VIVIKIDIYFVKKVIFTKNAIQIQMKMNMINLPILLLLSLLIQIYTQAYEGAPPIDTINNNDDDYSNTLPEADVYHNCIEPGMIALSYDDGPGIFTKNFIENIITDYRVTFYVNGWNYERLQYSPWHEVVKEAYDKGHEIGNHGWNHWSYTSASTMNSDMINCDLNNSQILEQITTVNDLVYKIIGKAPAIFRPPYGQYDEKTLRIAVFAGMTSMALWNIDSHDWDANSDFDSFETIINIVMAPGVSPKNSSFMIDLHEQLDTTILLTTPLLAIVLKKLGYTFVTVSECIGVSPYQTNYTPDINFTLFNNTYGNDTFVYNKLLN
jgi:peptidoglycan/xylan/chitin deacetylase (PgdA/CDA1 family)